MSWNSMSNHWKAFLNWFILLVLLPLFFLGVIELGLRIIDIGYSTSFTKKLQGHKPEAYICNDNFAKLFFPPALAALPQPFVITKDKPAHSYRIIVLGGSAAEGSPEPSYGFSRILDVFLEDQYPDVKFEVINLAITATNSHVALRVLKDVIDFHPDMLIVYSGNNEVVGPFGAGTVFASYSPNLSLIRAGLDVRSTRIGQLLDGFLLTLKHKESPKEWGGMSMFLNNQVRRTNPIMDKVYGNFKSNLEDILRIATENDVKIIISTVGSNIKDCAPFASLHKTNISDADINTWNQLFKSGISFQVKQKYPEAVELYLKASDIDETYADLQYRLGQCYWQLGDYRKAKAQFIKARELDTLRFRADNRINEIVRSISNENIFKDTYLVDAVEAIDQISPYNTPGEELFYEHVHFNFSGNYFLAKLMFNQITKILPGDINKMAANNPVPTLNECISRLAFTDYDKHRVLRSNLDDMYVKPPFINQIEHETWIKEKEQEASQYSVASYDDVRKMLQMYQLAIERRKDDPWLHYNFANFLINLKKYKEAENHLRKTLQIFPQQHSAQYLLGNALSYQGEYNEAIKSYQEALLLKPTFSSAAYALADTLTHLERFDDSLKIYEKLLVEHSRESKRIYSNIGDLWAQQKAFERAADSYSKAINVSDDNNPGGSPDLYFNLGFVLKKQGKQAEASTYFDMAIKLYQKVLSDSSPIDPATLAAKGYAWAELGNFSQAASSLNSAIELQPGNFTYQMNLIKFLEAQGKIGEAIAITRNAILLFQGQDRQNEVIELKKYQVHLNTLLPDGR